MFLIDLGIHSAKLTTLWKTLACYLVASVFACGALSAAAKTTNLLNQHAVQPAVEYILWDENEPDLAEYAVNPWPLDWSAPQTNTINLGFTQNSVWIRIPIKAPDEAPLTEQFVLYIDYPLLDKLDYFFVKNNRLLHHVPTGDMTPFSTRPIKHRSFSFPFTLGPGENATIYLRSKADDTLQFPMTVYTKEAFDYRRTKEQYIFGSYYGGLFTMMFFMVLLFFILRDKTLISFTAFTMCVIIITASLNGDTIHIFSESNPGINKWLRIIGLNIGAISMAIFTQEFLGTRQYLPRINKLINIIIFSTITVLITLFFLPFYYAIQITLVVTVVLSSLSLFTGVLSLRKNFTPASYYIVGWIAFLLGGFATVLRAFAILPTNFITDHGVQFGALLNVVTIALGIAHRFTKERKRLFSLEKANQEERHKKEKAQAEARAKSQFLANMSHEIRTPMNGVLGLTNLLKDTPLNAQQEQYVNTIENSGKALLTIINDILDFSKIEAGKMTIEKVDFNVDKLVTEASSLFASVADEKNLDFHIVCKSKIPAFIYSDPIRVRQILLNLLSNAFKFTEKGQVTIEYETIEKDGQPQIRFAVTDSGIGLTQEQKEQLFQSFVQADTSTTRQFGGTGLGLSISQKLCELLGGEIDVKSTYGEGSTFWFTIQSNLNEMPLQQTLEFKRHYHNLFKNKVIYIADTHIPTLSSLQIRFQQWQCQCKTFSSNALLMESLETDQNTLAIILDYDDLHASREYLKTTLEQLQQEKTLIIFSASPMIKPNLDETELHQPIRIMEKPLSFYRVYSLIEECLSDRATRQKNQNEGIDLAGLNVIVVEDNKINQMVIKGMLKRLGIQPALCDNGQQCVDTVTQSEKVDCIIMDCEMPVMDGYEATSNIRNMNNIEQPIIIGLSANALKEQEDKALAHGMNIYLRKPVDYEQLRATFLNHFSG